MYAFIFEIIIEKKKKLKASFSESRVMRVFVIALLIVMNKIKYIIFACKRSERGTHKLLIFT